MKRTVTSSCDGSGAKHYGWSGLSSPCPPWFFWEYQISLSQFTHSPFTRFWYPFGPAVGEDGCLFMETSYLPSVTINPPLTSLSLVCSILLSLGTHICPLSQCEGLCHFKEKWWHWECFRCSVKSRDLMMLLWWFCKTESAAVSLQDHWLSSPAQAVP